MKTQTYKLNYIARNANPNFQPKASLLIELNIMREVPNEGFVLERLR